MGSISQQAKPRKSTATTRVVFAVFLVAGLGFSLFFVVPAWKTVASHSWVPVKCEILESSVAAHSSDGSTTYSVEVRYRYRFESETYESDRYQFLSGSSSGRRGKQEVVDRLEAGSWTTCYVDPDDPHEAVLSRGFGWPYLFALLPLIFVLVGGVGLLFSLFGKSVAERAQATERAARSDRSRSSQDPNRHPGTLVDPWRGEPPSFAVRARSQSDAPGGRVRLEESISPLGKAGCLTFFALLWNGIVSIFVWQQWVGWRAGEGLGCQTIILAPFVVIGLGIIAGVVYQLMASANPQPRLTLSRGDIPVGGSAGLEWSFHGATERLESLRLWIEGAEKASYRRGTSSYTDTEVFATLELVDLHGTRSLAQGTVQIDLPIDTMHSFEASHNEIVWTLKLHASIARWPDVITEFPLVVAPAERRAR